MATYFGRLMAVLGGIVVLSAGATESLPLDAPLPDSVPPGTVLRVGSSTDLSLKLAGVADNLPFKLEVANITGGPGTINAFHAKALDIGTSQDIPAINAAWIGIDAKIVAIRLRQNEASTLYRFGIAPKAHIDSLADLRGKRIAYSPGQAQGALVLRTLAKYGIQKGEVDLVELPSTGRAYTDALAANLVDAAPIAGINVKRYEENYGKDGARILQVAGIKDDPSILWVRAETLKDPAKAAAIKAYVRAWARAQYWIDTHRDQWIDAYYVQDQGVSLEDARYILNSQGSADIPLTWNDAIAHEQQTIDFMARETGHKSFDAATLFDRRFETVAGAAYAQTP